MLLPNLRHATCTAVVASPLPQAFVTVDSVRVSTAGETTEHMTRTRCSERCAVRATASPIGDGARLLCGQSSSADWFEQ
jgi:hypothetical protein